MEGTWKGRALWIVLAAIGVWLVVYGAWLLTTHAEPGWLILGSIFVLWGIWQSWKAGSLFDFMWTGRA